jgi:hypothetical protein
VSAPKPLDATPSAAACSFAGNRRLAHEILELADLLLAVLAEGLV